METHRKFQTEELTFTPSLWPDPAFCFFETLDSKCCRICPTMALVKLPGITGFFLFWVITLIQKACKLERVKERDFHNTVLESHIYRQFLWYFRGENLCVWFSLLFTRGNGGVTGNCLVLHGEQVLESATGHTNPSYREYTLVVCCTSCIDNQVYKVKLKRNHKLINALTLYAASKFSMIC